MNIESAKYYKHPSSEDNQGIEIVSSGNTMNIPLDPANRHYQAILEWVEDGNTIEDAD
jgi:hypothetical protein